MRAEPPRTTQFFPNIIKFEFCFLLNSQQLRRLWGILSDNPELNNVSRRASEVPHEENMNSISKLQSKQKEMSFSIVKGELIKPLFYYDLGPWPNCSAE